MLMHPLSRLRRLLELLDEMFPAELLAAKLRLLAGKHDHDGTSARVGVGQLRRLAVLLDEPAPPPETVPLPAHPTDPPAPAWPGSSLPAADAPLLRTDAPDEVMEGQAD